MHKDISLQADLDAHKHMTWGGGGGGGTPQMNDMCGGWGKGGGKRLQWANYIYNRLLQTDMVSVVDPEPGPDLDPYWIRTQSGLQVRIRNRIRKLDPDPGGRE